MKIVGRNIKNLRCTDDTALMTEIEEKLKSLFMRMKEESEKTGLKFNIKKNKIMSSGPITSLQVSGKSGKSGNSGIFYFPGLQNHCKWWLQP